jgi:hypothetical protein
MIVALLCCITAAGMGLKVPVAIVTRYILIIDFTGDRKRGFGIVQVYRPR